METRIAQPLHVHREGYNHFVDSHGECDARSITRLNGAQHFADRGNRAHRAVMVAERYRDFGPIPRSICRAIPMEWSDETGSGGYHRFAAAHPPVWGRMRPPIRPVGSIPTPHVSGSTLLHFAWPIARPRTNPGHRLSQPLCVFAWRVSGGNGRNFKNEGRS